MYLYLSRTDTSLWHGRPPGWMACPDRSACHCTHGGVTVTVLCAAYLKVHWSRLTGLWGPKAQSKFQNEIRSRFIRNDLHSPTPSSKLTHTAIHPPSQQKECPSREWWILALVSLDPGRVAGVVCLQNTDHFPYLLQARGRIITEIKLKEKQIYDDGKFLTKLIWPELS